MRWAVQEWGLPGAPNERAYRRRVKRYRRGKGGTASPTTRGREIETNYGGDSGRVTVRSLDVKTLDDALEVADVDPAEWDVDRYTINSWEVTLGSPPQTVTNWQVKVWLKRKSPEIRSLDALLVQIRDAAPAPVPLSPPPETAQNRLLELSIIDVHNGLRCAPPTADAPWSPELAEKVLLDTSAALLDRVQPFGPYQQIVVPIGHDWMHIDTPAGTTTRGTPQPEADEWHSIFLHGEQLAIKWVLALREIAPVRVVVVPGNHDWASGFALGRVLAAYFHNDPRVDVDAGSDPYKWIRWGVNLIGLLHKIKAPIRLSGLMANERPQDWAETRWREWHVGDQHRTGNASPVVMEEQGVGVEFLPSIVPANEWHRRKGLNHQRRAGTAHVWDATEGPICRVVRGVEI